MFIGSDLRQIRKKYRLKRGELGSYLGVSAVTVEKWEQNGSKPIRSKYTEKLAALGSVGVTGIGMGLLTAPATLPFAGVLGAFALASGFSGEEDLTRVASVVNKLKKLSREDREKFFEILNKLES